MKANLQHVRLFTDTVDMICSHSAENDQLLSIQEIFDQVRDRLQKGDNHIPYKRVANTLLQSDCILTMSGRPVEKLNDKRPLTPFPRNSLIMQKCEMIIRETNADSNGEEVN